jgi:hypothetical protein
MSFSERRERSDRRSRGDRRYVVSQDLYERLKEKRVEIERERRQGPRRQADRRTTKDPHPASSNSADEAQREAERSVKDAD